MSHAQIQMLRTRARAIFDRAVAAADPARALAQGLSAHPLPQPGPGGRTLLVAIGKAAPAMMHEALQHVRGPHQALVITHYENQMTVTGAQILRAAHPVPDENGLLAGKAVIELLAQARPQDQVVALISGGGSALVPAPVPGIGISDKAEFNALLLASGLDIVRMNLIRQQLSQLKGGGILRHAAPAPVTSYILSDVIGDDLRAVASGPTVAPIGSHADARRACIEADIWHQLPDTVRRFLDQSLPPADPPRPGVNVLVGSNRHSLRAALAEAADGFDARIVSDAMIGDVEDAARDIVRACCATPPDAPRALLFGGETTVRLQGDGLGGRNQELALRVARLLSRSRSGADWVFLSGGTDGRDGPTEAAGGLVDPQSLDRIRGAGLRVETLLARNDSHTALQAAGDLLVTGATGTNVADIQCLLFVPQGMQIA